MSILNTLGIFAGIMLVSQLAHSQGQNLFEFGGNMLGKAGDFLQMLSGNPTKSQEEIIGDGTVEQTQQTNQQQVAVKEDGTIDLTQQSQTGQENSAIAQEDAVNLSTQTTPGTETLHEIADESINENMNGKFTYLDPEMATPEFEMNMDAQNIAEDLYAQGVELKEGEDPRSQLKTDLLKVQQDNMPKGINGTVGVYSLSDVQNKASGQVVDEISKSGKYVINQEKAEKFKGEKDAVSAMISADSKKLDSKESIANARMMMSSAYVEGKNGKKESADNAIENAIKKLAKDKKVKEELKILKGSKGEGRNRANVRIAARFDKYLEEEGVKGVKSEMNPENNIPQTSLSDVNSKVSAETKSMSETKTMSDGKVETMDQINKSTKTAQQTKEANTKETIQDR